MSKADRPFMDTFCPQNTMKTIDLTSVIKTRNKIFRAATKAEKRVLIAKDVLTMLSNKKIIAERGNFTNIIGEDNESGGTSFQNLLLGKNEVQCQCCALGGLMTSCVGYVNDMTLDETFYGLGWSKGESKAAIKLKKFFSIEQLQLIEIAFEKGEGYYSCYYPDEIEKKAANFTKRLDPRGASRKIMKNIIDNNGTFVP